MSVANIVSPTPGRTKRHSPRYSKNEIFKLLRGADSAKICIILQRFLINFDRMKRMYYIRNFCRAVFLKSNSNTFSIHPENLVHNFKQEQEGRYHHSESKNSENLSVGPESVPPSQYKQPLRSLPLQPNQMTGTRINTRHIAKFCA